MDQRICARCGVDISARHCKAKVCVPCGRPRPTIAAANRARHAGQFLYENRVWMYDAYVTRQRSLRQVAAEAQCGARTVVRWLGIHDIPVRSMSEGSQLIAKRGPEHPNWNPERPTCPDCGGPRNSKATTCTACYHKRQGGAGNYNWRGDEVDYPGAHDRVKALHGVASTHSCRHCGKKAAHWAYDHVDPDEKQGADGPYSTDVRHYLPLCVSCHKRFDMAYLKAQGSKRAG